jgi:hypothetical protein
LSIPLLATGASGWGFPGVGVVDRDPAPELDGVGVDDEGLDKRSPESLISGERISGGSRIDIAGYIMRTIKGPCSSTPRADLCGRAML